MNTRRLLAAALLLGAALRLGAAAAYLRAPLTPGGDDGQYYELAQNLAHGRGYLWKGEPCAYRLPLYPLFLAAIFRLGGSLGAARLAQALCGILTLGLVYKIGKLLHSTMAGALGALILALYPEQILLPASLYSECLYAALVLLALWASARWLREPSPGHAALAGAAFGLSLLARSTLLCFLPLLFARRRKAGLLLLCAALPLAPWALRNALIFKKFIPLETGLAGPIFWYGSMGYLQPPEDMRAAEPMKTMYATLPHTAWDGYSFPLAFGNIRNRPGRYALSTGKRLLWLWSDSYLAYLLHDHPRLRGFMESNGRWDRVRWLDRLMRLSLILAALWGLKRGASPGMRYAAALAAYFSLYAAGAVFVRYIAPATPVLCVLAGIGLARLQVDAAPLGIALKDSLPAEQGSGR